MLTPGPPDLKPRVANTPPRCRGRSARLPRLERLGGRFSGIARPARRPPYLQLLEFLPGQKALASRLEQDDAGRRQPLPLLLEPRDHACLEEDLEGQKAAGDSCPAESDRRKCQNPVFPCACARYSAAGACDRGSMLPKHPASSRVLFPFLVAPGCSERGPHKWRAVTTGELVRNAESGTPPAESERPRTPILRGTRTFVSEPPSGGTCLNVSVPELPAEGGRCGFPGVAPGKAASVG